MMMMICVVKTKLKSLYENITGIRYSLSNKKFVEQKQKKKQKNNTASIQTLALLTCVEYAEELTHKFFFSFLFGGIHSNS